MASIEVPTRDQTPCYKIIGHVGKTLVLRNRHELDNLSDLLIGMTVEVKTATKEFEMLAEILDISNKLAIQHTRENG